MNMDAPRTPRPGSVILRGFALILDLLIIFILAAIVIGPDRMTYGIGLATYLSGWSLYFIGFTMTMGATPGKIAVGIHVAGKDGRRPRPDSVILRYVVMLAGAVTFGAGTVVSMLLVASDRQHRRALHDRIAGTLVLDGRPPIEEWQRQEERER